VPRPANAFILFRADVNDKAKASGESHQKAVSGAARDLWNEHKAAEDDTYWLWKANAEEEKRLHALRYPNYKYQPRKRETVKKSRK
ncbi:hypothetical protein BKA62DRAFT_584415, partial [Auriculariales sp. MPI-PUGE-AT-0066]